MPGIRETNDIVTQITIVKVSLQHQAEVLQLMGALTADEAARTCRRAVGAAQGVRQGAISIVCRRRKWFTTTTAAPFTPWKKARPASGCGGYCFHALNASAKDAHHVVHMRRGLTAASIFSRMLAGDG
jgi:hypothetical protein